MHGGGSDGDGERALKKVVENMMRMRMRMVGIKDETMKKKMKKMKSTRLLSKFGH